MHWSMYIAKLEKLAKMKNVHRSCPVRYRWIISFTIHFILFANKILGNHIIFKMDLLFHFLNKSYSIYYYYFNKIFCLFNTGSNRSVRAVITALPYISVMQGNFLFTTKASCAGEIFFFLTQFFQCFHIRSY